MAVGDDLCVGVATVGVLLGAVAVGDDVAGVGETGVGVWVGVSEGVWLGPLSAAVVGEGRGSVSVAAMVGPAAAAI